MSEPTSTQRTQPLVSVPRGLSLLDFVHAPEDAVFDDGPVGFSLVALWHAGRVLMTHQRVRDCWELPGGGIEPGESPRVGAARELLEETGQAVDPDALRFVGFARMRRGDRPVLYGAFFTAQAAEALPFMPNDEVTRIHWRHGEELLPGEAPVQNVDEYLVSLCGG
jgi:8-oxo-dGTP pyrophosphatase MutT (NUDIX family)